jgi:hypothetical protein
MHKAGDAAPVRSRCDGFCVTVVVGGRAQEHAAKRNSTMGRAGVCA